MTALKEVAERVATARRAQQEMRRRRPEKRSVRDRSVGRRETASSIADQDLVINPNGSDAEVLQRYRSRLQAMRRHSARASNIARFREAVDREAIARGDATVDGIDRCDLRLGGDPCSITEACGPGREAYRRGAKC
jgi:hypothetical protein